MRHVSPAVLLAASMAAVVPCSTPAAEADPPTARAQLEREVGDTERAFAKTMADRDATHFASFVSEEAVFFAGDQPLRGRAEVARRWAKFFEKPAPPFSWEPDQVQVLDSGTLAISSGPVRDAAGKPFARFTSIWRREAPGTWRIVFDKGSDLCEAAH